MNKYILFKNKKINLNYFIQESYEAGIELNGSEVKSLVNANGNIDQAFVIFKHNEAYIINMYIAPYKHTNTIEENDGYRNRKLLLHKKEIIKIQYLMKKNRWALIPNMVYLLKNKIKIELSLTKSKKKSDKREDIKKRDADREIRQY